MGKRRCLDSSRPIDKRDAYERQETRRRERQHGDDEDDFDTRLSDGFDMLENDDVEDDVVGKFTSREQEYP